MRSTTSWKIGRSRLSATQTELDKLYSVLDMIKRAEEKHANLIEYSNGQICIWFPQMKAKTIREAAITLAAHDRLVKYFNHCISDIGL